MNGRTGTANIITGFRILCSIALLFCSPFSPPFYALYLVAGLTDMIDGLIARKTNTVSAFGARLDTTADFALVAVCLWKLLPKLAVPSWLWLWIWGIALIKAVNIVSGLILQKRFVVLHTAMNKVTGVLLFILPLTLRIIDLRTSGGFVCALATFAAVQEGHHIRTGRESLLKTGNE